MNRGRIEDSREGKVEVEVAGGSRSEGKAPQGQESRPNNRWNDGIEVE